MSDVLVPGFTTHDGLTNPMPYDPYSRISLAVIPLGPPSIHRFPLGISAWLLLLTLSPRHGDRGLRRQPSQKDPQRDSDLAGERDRTEQSQNSVRRHRQSEADIKRI